MSAPPHVVLRGRIELSAPDRETARRAQDDCADRWAGDVAPALDAALSRAEAIHGPLVLDRLELDVGPLPAEDLVAALAAAVAEALPAALAAAVARGEGAAPEADPAPGTSGGRALSFARRGHLPWWAEDAPPAALADELRAWCAAGGPARAAAVVGDPTIVARAAAQWGPAFVEALRAMAAGAALDELRTVSRVADSAQPPASGPIISPETVSRVTIGGTGNAAPATQRAAPAAEGRAPGPADPAPRPPSPDGARRRGAEPAPSRAVAAVAPGSIAAPADPHARALDVPGAPAADRGGEGAAPIRPAHALIESDPPATPAREGSTGESRSAEAPPANRAAEVAAPQTAVDGPDPAAPPGSHSGRSTRRRDAAASDPPAGFEHAPPVARSSTPPRRPVGPAPVLDAHAALRAEDPAGHPAPPAPAAPAAPAGPPAPAAHPSAPASAAPLGGPASSAPRPSAPGSAASSAPVVAPPAPDPLPPIAPRRGERIPIGHAGLVLVWPFLPAAFARLGFRDADDWRPGGRDRAIHWLHRVATGAADAPETRLVLPKLLCGAPLADPAPRALPLAPEAHAAADALLADAITHWGALGATSPDGLRRGFIAREGLLTCLEPDWRLRVERLTHDVLLDRLPWGIATIRFRWTPYTLAVEW